MYARTSSPDPAPSPLPHLRWARPLHLLLALAVPACADLPTQVDDEAGADPCLSTTQISLGQSIGGQLTSSDCAPFNGPHGDRWSLSLSARTTVRIDLSSSQFDAYLELRTGAGSVIAENDDTQSLDSRIVSTLPAGSYVIVARSLGPQQLGNYQLSVREAPDCSSLGALQLGVGVSGDLSADDCLSDFGGASDNWTLSLASSQKLRLDLKSTSFDEILLVRDQQGNIVNGADWNGPTGFARLDTQLTSGVWTISVTAPHETARGPYELLVDAAPPCTPGVDYVLGEAVDGDLSTDDCFIDWGMPADSFGLRIAEETPISIHLKSADFNPLVILRDQDGMDVAVGWDEMGNGNALVRVTLEPGSYSLFVASGSYPQEGSYRLTVSEIDCSTAGTIDFAQTVTGALGTDDCTRAGGAFQQSWALVLTEDATVRVDLKSGAFDPYLLLKDNSGAVIEVDDDDGDRFDARIERALTAGAYEIVVSSFAGGQTGAYSLSVGAPPAAGAGVAGRIISGQPPLKVQPAPTDASERLGQLRRELEAARGSGSG